MKKQLRVIALLCLTGGTLSAQQAVVTPLDVQGFVGESRERTFHDHGGVCARRLGPDPPTQRTWPYLCAGGVDRDAGEGWAASNADPGPNLL